MFSIDYAVMEKSKDIYTLPAEFGWSDLGSWGSLRTLLPQDEAGNAKVGKDLLFERRTEDYGVWKVVYLRICIQIFCSYNKNSNVSYTIRLF